MQAQAPLQTQLRRPGMAREWLSTGGPFALMLAAVVLWWAALPLIDPRQITDVGLAPALPGVCWAAFGVMCIGFAWSLAQQPLRTRALALHVVIMVVLLYGITTLVEGGPRFEAVWKHIGITDYIARNGSVDPGIDAYFNWPSFFILSAFVTQIGGLENAAPLVVWAPVFFNLLYLGPLLLIFRAATDDQRLVWLGVWLFYLTNWIGQDYFSPQALNYFLYLAIIAIILTWFKNTGAVTPLPARFEHLPVVGHWLPPVYGWLTAPATANRPSDGVQRAGIVGIVVLVFAASVPSHQLTPFASLAAVAVLIGARRSSLRGLPLVMAVLIGAWISYMAATFLRGHLVGMLGDVGRVGNAVGAGVARRVQGSPGHRLIIYARIGLTLALWGWAFWGGLRRLRRGARDGSLALLALTPFGLVALQGYGGELLLRIYLFALPFMCFFAAALVLPSLGHGRTWRTPLLVGALSGALVVGFMFCRYGNERMDYFAADEVDAMRYVYSVAPPDSLVVGGSFNYPVRFQGYETYRYTVIDDLLDKDDAQADEVGVLDQLAQDERDPGTFVVLTRSQKAQTELFGGLSPEAWARMEHTLQTSSQWQRIWSSTNAQVFRLLAPIQGATDEGQAQPKQGDANQPSQ